MGCTINYARKGCGRKWEIGEATKGVRNCQVVYRTSAFICNVTSDMKHAGRARVSPDGRIVIPASFRKILGIKSGDEVTVRIEDNELRVSTLKAHIERAQRLVRRHVKHGTSLVDELIAERRREADRD